MSNYLPLFPAHSKKKWKRALSSSFPLLPVCSCFQHCKSMLFCSFKARMQINCQYFTTHIFHSVNIIGFTQEDYFLFSATQGWENRGSQRLFSRLTTLWDADVEPMKKTRMRNIISWRPEQSHPLLCSWNTCYSCLSVGVILSTNNPIGHQETLN